MQRILILAANPLDSSRLRLDEELREIEAVLSRAKQHDRFEIRPQFATRPSDIQQALLDYNPQIVHFCGHGEGDKGLIFESDRGESQFVDSQALANLFELFADQVKCVVLNACYSEVQAAAIVAHIDAVIGMNQPIGDMAAIRFAEGFYRGLGAGKDVDFSYKLGRNALELQGIPEEHIPVLRQREPAFDSAQASGERLVVSSSRTGDSAQASGEPEAASNSPADTLSVASDTASDPARKRKVAVELDEPEVRRSRIFISYKRDVEPDTPVAQSICAALQQHHDVFIDQKMLVGTRWAARIEAEIEAADVLIVLLSAHSVHSEIVEHEVALAHRFAAAHNDHPRIFPVRLAYQQPFQYPLSEHLNPLNWAVWDEESDTDGLIDELLRAIASLVISSAADGDATSAKTNPAAKPAPTSPTPTTTKKPKETTVFSFFPTGSPAK